MSTSISLAELAALPPDATLTVTEQRYSVELLAVWDGGRKVLLSRPKDYDERIERIARTIRGER